MNRSKVVSIGGWSLVLFTVLYLGVQVCLMTIYDYPVSIYNPGLGILPVLLTGGQPLTILLSVFSLTPLLLMIGGVGAYYAFKDVNEPAMRISVLFATLTAIGFILYLMYWPSFNLALASAYDAASPDQRGVLGIVLQSLNTYVGVYIGGFFTSICAAIWFLIVSVTMLKTIGFPKWIGWIGIVASVFMIVQVFAAFGAYPETVTFLLNKLTPIDSIWMFVFGIGLIAYRNNSV